MLRWMDGFEQYGDLETHMLEGVGGAAAYATVENTWALSSVNPATGDRNLRLTDTSSPPSRLRRVLGQAWDTAGVGYRFNVDDLPNTEGSESEERLNMCRWKDVSNVSQAHIGMGTDGSLVAYLGSTTLGRSDPVFSAGGYHHFECKTKVANSGGFIEARINEVTVLNLTGIDTQATANAHAAQVEMGLLGSVLSGSVGFNFLEVDDMFAWDTDDSDPENTVVDFVGDKGCYYLQTNQDTGEIDWTIVGAATAWEVLDEIPPNTADYLSDTTGAARAVVQVEPLPANIAEVIAMMPVIYGRKEESGTVNLNAGVVIGSSESYTPTDSPSTEYAYMTPGPKTIDPSTGVAWANDANPDLLIQRTA